MPVAVGGGGCDAGAVGPGEPPLSHCGGGLRAMLTRENFVIRTGVHFAAILDIVSVKGRGHR